MNRETNFMNFENLNRLIEEHKKETHPYKKYEFDSTSYTMLLIDINNLVKENKVLKENAENNDKVVDKTNWENQLLKKENKQLKDNWNKLREWIVYNKHNENTKQHYLVVDYGTLLGKMREIEQEREEVSE